MDSESYRKWAMQWAVRLDRDPDKFLKQLEKVDLKTATDEEVEKALDLPKGRGTYIKRGWARFGKAKRKPGPTLANGQVNFRIIARAQQEYQKLLEKKIWHEAEIKRIDAELEKHRPIAKFLEGAKTAVQKWEAESKKS